MKAIKKYVSRDIIHRTRGRVATHGAFDWPMNRVGVEVGGPLYSHIWLDVGWRIGHGMWRKGA